MPDEKTVRQLANVMRPVLLPIELACMHHQERNQAAIEALARETLRLWKGGLCDLSGSNVPVDLLKLARGAVEDGDTEKALVYLDTLLELATT